MILHPESFWNFKEREGRDVWLLTRGCLLSQPPINPLPRFFRAQKWPLDEDSTLEPEGKTTAPFPCLPGGFPSVNPSLAAPSLHSHLCKEAQIAPPGASPRGCVSVCKQCLHNSPSSEQPLGTNWAAELSRGAGGAQGPEPLPVLSRVLGAAPAGDALEKAGLWGSLCAVGILRPPHSPGHCASADLSSGLTPVATACLALVSLKATHGKIPTFPVPYKIITRGKKK